MSKGSQSLLPFKKCIREQFEVIVWPGFVLFNFQMSKEGWYIQDTIAFGFLSHWMKERRQFCEPITERLIPSFRFFLVSV